MSRAQYAFIVGVLLVWLAWAAGWVVFPAIAAGLIGWGAVRVLEGDVDLGEISERFRSTSSRPRAAPDCAPKGASLALLVLFDPRYHPFSRRNLHMPENPTPDPTPQNIPPTVAAGRPDASARSGAVASVRPAVVAQCGALPVAAAGRR